MGKKAHRFLQSDFHVLIIVSATNSPEKYYSKSFLRGESWLNSMDSKKLKCMGLKHSEKYFEKDYVTIFLRLMNCSQWKKC